MRIYRIADGRHPVWDGMGAALLGGRWNSPGRALIYGSLSYACCMLEILAHANTGRIPATHRYVVATIPDRVSWEQVSEDCLPADWDSDDSASAREYGDCWLAEARSAILLVPSVVARLEWNALVNPAHPDAKRLFLSEPAPVIWDRRLFKKES